jgi:hypothetical protein
LLGLIVFIVWGGIHTFSPKHVAWVMSGLDTAAQYLGWSYFRNAPWWQWPLGANPSYGTDAPGTIVLADTIPICALFFKLWNPLLPTDFQYFGAWACLCFLLQAWFGYKLMRRLSGDFSLVLLGSCFFLTASVFLVRVYIHPALAAQWIILAAIYLATDVRVRGKAWWLLLSIAALTHAYLLVMAGSIWAACMVRQIWVGAESRPALIRYMGAVTSSTVLIMWAVGYFVPASVTPMSIRMYANLLTPIWPGFCGQSWSWVLPCSKFDASVLSSISDGFGYFGLGYLLLVVIAAGLLVWGRARTTGAFQCQKNWALLLVSLLLLIYAIGEKVYFGTHLLVAIPIPSWLERLSSVFRGAARMEWPAWYLFMLATLGIVVSRLNPRSARIVLAIALLVQCCDLSKAVLNNHQQIEERSHTDISFASPQWSELGQFYRHMAFIEQSSWTPYRIGWSGAYRVSTLIMTRQAVSVNVAYLARLDEPVLAVARAKREALLLGGQFEPSTFYVVEDLPMWERILCAPDHGQWHGMLDNVRVLIPAPPAALALPPTQSCNGVSGTPHAS